MNDEKLLEILYKQNPHWEGGALEAGYPREILPAVLAFNDARETTVLKGIRRCGKTTLLAQVINQLLSRDIPPAQILRINLEEPLFSREYSIELLERIFRLYQERKNPTAKTWLFLDEVQNIPAWERWVRGRSESEAVKIYVTGSSANLLSREIGTKLTGRHVSFTVYPLSFREFLIFNQCPPPDPDSWYGQKPLLRHLLQQYLCHGGFPEVVKQGEAAKKELLLKQYFDDILFRDVVARHEIRDVHNLTNIAVFLMTNMAARTSVKKLKDNLGLSQDKTEHYLSALLEACLFFTLRKFSFSYKQQLRAGFKVYAADNGLRNRIAFTFSEDSGRSIENLVFNHLNQNTEELFFTANGGEIDFLVKEGTRVKTLYQVWYSSDPKQQIPSRELAALSAAGAAWPDAEKVLLTNNYEDSITREGSTIQCRPVLKFLLGL